MENIDKHKDEKSSETKSIQVLPLYKPRAINIRNVYI